MIGCMCNLLVYKLYVKQHNITRLKYLGYTKNPDPYSYSGSGTYWCNHINKHGYNVTTEIIYESNILEDIKGAGIYYEEKMSYLQDKLKTLTLFQLMELEITLKLMSKEKMVELEQDLSCISGIDANEELANVLRVDIYNFLTGEQVESMVKPIETFTEKVDIMAAIRASCGR